MGEPVGERLYTSEGQLVYALADTAVADDEDAVIADINVSGLEIVSVFISVADEALDTFKVLGGVRGGPLVPLFDEAADFETPVGPLVNASGDLTTLAADAVGWFFIDVRGLDRLQVLARSADAAGSTVTVNAGGM